jgi:hypothetical protein
LTAPPGEPRRAVVITALGLTQILAWGSSYYLPAVLAKPIAADTGWPLSFVIGGLSLGLLAGGLVSPAVGRAIDRTGGRPVLAASSLLLALGLAGLGIAPNLPSYFVAWALIGLGMGAGLYDAGFATLGTLYGKDARRMIVTLTLFGGFAPEGGSENRTYRNSDTQEPARACGRFFDWRSHRTAFCETDQAWLGPDRSSFSLSSMASGAKYTLLYLNAGRAHRRLARLTPDYFGDHRSRIAQRVYVGKGDITRWIACRPSIPLPGCGRRLAGRPVLGR